MNPGKIYFASDFHLGAPNREQSREREQRIVRWLNKIQKDASEIYLVGDVFDFWFEYKKAIPKGFVRLQGKLAELSDSGVKIYYFTGNHDMWVFDYLPEELGMQLHTAPIIRKLNGKVFLIGHGDGLGPGDKGYKFIKKIFSSRVCQWLFKVLHPDIGIWLAEYWSGQSRKSTEEMEYLGEDREWLVQYCKDQLKDQHVDYFIFGHRHLPLDLKIGDSSRYINLGEWMQYNSYGVYDGDSLSLQYFND